jgi:hypothetical protein
MTYDNWTFSSNWPVDAVTTFLLAPNRFTFQGSFVGSAAYEWGVTVTYPGGITQLHADFHQKALSGLAALFVKTVPGGTKTGPGSSVMVEKENNIGIINTLVYDIKYPAGTASVVISGKLEANVGGDVDFVVCECRKA